MRLAVALLLLAATPSANYLSAKRKLAMIENDRAAPRSVVSFTWHEINDYARYRAEELVPGVLRNPKVELRHDRAVGSALVDFAKLRAAQGQPPGRLLGWLLSGERPVNVTVRLESQGGHCRVDVERVELSGVEIDGRALDFLIENFLRPLYPDLKIGKPFELDHRVERIDVRSASVYVRIGG